MSNKDEKKSTVDSKQSTKSRRNAPTQTPPGREEKDKKKKKTEAQRRWRAKRDAKMGKIPETTKIKKIRKKIEKITTHTMELKPGILGSDNLGIVELDSGFKKRINDSISRNDGDDTEVNSGNRERVVIDAIAGIDTETESEIPKRMLCHVDEFEKKRGELIEQRINELHESSRQLAIDVHKESALNLLSRMTSKEKEFCLMISTGASPRDAVSIIFPEEIKKVEKQIRITYTDVADINRYLATAMNTMCTIVQSRPAVKAYLNVLNRLGTSRIGLTLEMADERLIDIITANPTDLLEEGDFDFEGHGGRSNNNASGKAIKIKPLDTWGPAEKNSIVGVKVNRRGETELKFADRLKALDIFYRRHGGYVSSGEGNNLNVQINSANEQVHVFAMPGDNGRGSARLGGDSGCAGDDDD